MARKRISKNKKVKEEIRAEEKYPFYLVLLILLTVLTAVYTYQQEVIDEQLQLSKKWAIEKAQKVAETNELRERKWFSNVEMMAAHETTRAILESDNEGMPSIFKKCLENYLMSEDMTPEKFSQSLGMYIHGNVNMRTEGLLHLLSYQYFNDINTINVSELELEDTSAIRKAYLNKEVGGQKMYLSHIRHCLKNTFNRTLADTIGFESGALFDTKSGTILSEMRKGISKSKMLDEKGNLLSPYTELAPSIANIFEKHFRGPYKEKAWWVAYIEDSILEAPVKPNNKNPFGKLTYEVKLQDYQKELNTYYAEIMYTLPKIYSFLLADIYLYEYRAQDLLVNQEHHLEQLKNEIAGLKNQYPEKEKLIEGKTEELALVSAIDENRKNAKLKFKKETLRAEKILTKLGAEITADKMNELYASMEIFGRPMVDAPAEVINNQLRAQFRELYTLEWANELVRNYSIREVASKAKTHITKLRGYDPSKIKFGLWDSYMKTCFNDVEKLSVEDKIKIISNITSSTKRYHTLASQFSDVDFRQVKKVAIDAEIDSAINYSKWFPGEYDVVIYCNDGSHESISIQVDDNHNLVSIDGVNISMENQLLVKLN